MNTVEFLQNRLMGDFHLSIWLLGTTSPFMDRPTVPGLAPWGTGKWSPKDKGPHQAAEEGR